jgi:hypothetical protein
MLPADGAIEALLEELRVPAENEKLWLELLAGDSDHVQIVAMLRILAEQMGELSDAVTAAYFAQTQDLATATVMA